MLLYINILIYDNLRSMTTGKKFRIAIMKKRGRAQKTVIQWCHFSYKNKRGGKKIMGGYKNITIKWDYPIEFSSILQKETMNDIGLYYISRKFGNKESMLKRHTVFIAGLIHIGYIKSISIVGKNMLD